jgi:hypothetical protein
MSQLRKKAKRKKKVTFISNGFFCAHLERYKVGDSMVMLEKVAKVDPPKPAFRDCCWCELGKLLLHHVNYLRGVN